LPRRTGGRNLCGMRDLEPIRGQIRVTGFRRVSHGLYLPLSDRTDEDAEWLRNLQAWLLVLPPDAVFTHVTAAALYGWWLPQLPDFVPVFAATDVTGSRPRRPGLICSRLVRTAEAPANAIIRHGLPVDLPEEVLLRAARDLAMLDLVPLVESALRSGDTSIARLKHFCETTRPGVRRLRIALALADPRSESPWETVLRLFHVLVGIEVQPQVELFDDQGTFLARVDLLLTGTDNVHEYDGSEHRNRARHGSDLRGERGVAATPYVRRGFTSEDLVQHPLVMLAEIDRALGRRHRPTRVHLWRRWVSEATLSTAGRRRLMNRWMRLSGITDWSQTA
jgi:hypothetical protein